MAEIPTLYTPRLTLRPFSRADAARIQFLAGDARVAATTAMIPHPYPDGEAERWLGTHAQAAREKREFTFAVTLAGTRSPAREHDLGDSGHVIGAIAIGADGNAGHGRGVLGYWIGVPYWNKGFATEAAQSVIKFAFEKLEFHRVLASHVESNVVSGRVLQKLGMTREGVLAGHVQKNGQFHDVVSYGLLRDEWRLRRYKPPFFREKSAGRTLTATPA